MASRSSPTTPLSLSLLVTVGQCEGNRCQGQDDSPAWPSREDNGHKMISDFAEKHCHTISEQYKHTVADSCHMTVT